MAEWTEERRKEFGAKMRKLREEKQAAKEQGATAMEDVAEAPEPEPETPAADLKSNIDDIDLKSLLKQVAELTGEVGRLRAISQQAAPLQQATVGGRGIIGTFEKYHTDPDYYPDPTERLSREPRLSRFAFPINYELKWAVSTSSYETKDGINTVEPKFTLTLIKIVMDEEGEPTTERYELRTAVFHEDPQAAIVVAREKGLEIDKTNEKVFLDEMRYIRMKDWLLEAFYPAKLTTPPRLQEKVINNRVVKVYNVSGQDDQRIDWTGVGKIK